MTLGDPSLATTGATLAGDISKELVNSKNLANSKQVANVKGDKVRPNGAAASVAVQVWPQAPIVMGRSVSLHHKTKLHHVKAKPLSDMPQVPSSGRHVRARRSPIIIIRAGCGVIFRDLDVEVANQARPPLRQVFAQVREQRRPVAIIVAACIAWPVDRRLDFREIPR
jgi:hypothetical protein